MLFGPTHPVRMWRSVAWACIPAIPPLPASTPQPPTSVTVREASQEMEFTTATRHVITSAVKAGAAGVLCLSASALWVGPLIQPLWC